MSPSEQANPVRDTGFQQQKLQNNLTELLQKSVKDFSKWSTTKQMAAVSIVGAVFFTALPILPLIITGAVVGLALFFTVNAVLRTFQGIQWSGKKTKDGIKYVAKGAVKGFMYSKDKVVEGCEHLMDSLRSGASRAANATADKLYRLAGETNYLDEIKKFTPEELKKANDVKKDMKGIFADEENNSGLVKSILSEIRSKIIPQIDSKINESKDLLKSMKKIMPTDTKAAEEGIQELTKNIEKLEGQKKFVNDLNTGKLQKLLTKRSLPKDSYFIYSIFHENYDEIKDIIREEKFHASVRHNNTAAKTRGRSKSAPAQPTSSLPKSGSSNSLNSVSTNGSTAELLNPKKHKEMKRSSWFSWPIRGKSAKKKTTKIGYQIFSEPSPVKTATTRANRNPSQARVPIPVTPPKPPRAFMTRSNSSGNLNSSMNYPERLNPFVETVSTGPDYDEPLRIRSNSSVSLASTDTFVSAMGDSVSTDSFSAFQGSEMPKAPQLPLDGQIPTIRSESPSTDSGVSSAGSSTPKKFSSMGNINNHSGPQVPVNQKEFCEKWNSLTGSLKKLVPPKSQTDLPKVQHPASEVPGVPSNSSRSTIQ